MSWLPGRLEVAGGRVVPWLGVAGVVGVGVGVAGLGDGVAGLVGVGVPPADPVASTTSAAIGSEAPEVARGRAARPGPVTATRTVSPSSASARI